jgi:dolichol-phosphate mannosyltransferase
MTASGTPLHVTRDHPPQDHLTASSSPHDRWLAAAALAAVAVALVLLTLTAIHLGGASRSGDVNRFYRLGAAHGRPYVDYRVEYPILTLGVFKVIAFVTDDRHSFGLVLVWLNVAASLGIAVLLLRNWGRGAALLFLVAAVFMAHLIDARADAISTAMATGGVAALRRRRPGRAGVLLGWATLTKLWAGPLLLWSAATREGRCRRYRHAAAGTTIGLGLVWLGLGGVRGIIEVLTYRHARGWEIETLPGLLLLARHHGGALMEAGAYRIGTVSPASRALLNVAAIGGSGLAAIRGGRVRRLGVAWIASVGALLVFSTLLSPQFIFWLLPAAAIAWSEGDRAAALTVALCAPLTGLEMHRLSWLLQARPAWLVLVGGRDVLLLAAVAISARRLARAEPRARPLPSAPLLDPRILVVVPTFDEIENVQDLLGRIRNAVPTAELLVIDDNSPDGTGDLVAAIAETDPAIHLMRRPGKAGLGSAYRAGFAWGIERRFSIILEMDADLSHDPLDLPRLVAAVTDGADLAVGSRYVPGGHVLGWPWRRELLSRSANRFARTLLHLDVADSTSGFRAFRLWLLEQPELGVLDADGYAFQIQGVLAARRLHARIVEVPITFSDRLRGRSKMDSRIIGEAARIVLREAGAEVRSAWRDVDATAQLNTSG